MIYKGQGQVSPIAVSPDGKTVLLGRYFSIDREQALAADVASGKLTELNPSKAKIAYDGGLFTPDGRSVLLRALDEGSDFLRLVQIDLVTGAKVNVSGERPWDIEDFALSDDGRILAYVVNEDGLFEAGRAGLPHPARPAAAAAAGRRGRRHRLFARRFEAGLQSGHPDRGQRRLELGRDRGQAGALDGLGAGRSRSQGVGRRRSWSATRRSTSARSRPSSTSPSWRPA
ncbi:hypothetical protein ACRAWD_23295 [Caulobacter segnis]